jgi:hypothetical protein
MWNRCFARHLTTESPGHIMDKHLTHNMLTLEEETASPSYRTPSTSSSSASSSSDGNMARLGNRSRHSIELQRGFPHRSRALYPALQRLEAKEWISSEWAFRQITVGPDSTSSLSSAAGTGVCWLRSNETQSVADTPNQLLPVCCCRNEAVMVQQTQSLGRF